jgi:hypothetical protein
LQKQLALKQSSRRHHHPLHRHSQTLMDDPNEKPSPKKMDLTSLALALQEIDKKEQKTQSVIQTLIQHPRTKRMRFNTERSHPFFEYQRQGSDRFEYIEGLTKRILSQTFWPNFVFTEATSFGEATVREGWRRDLDRLGLAQTELKTPETKSAGMLGVPIFYVREEAMERGTRIHDQIKDFIKMEKPAFERKHKAGVDKQTVFALSHMMETLQLELVASEYMIFDEEVGFATSIDVLATRRNDRNSVVLIEIKTGRGGAHFTNYANGIMTLPDEMKNKRFTNTLLNQAMMQVLLERLVLIKHYDVPGKCIECYVLQVNDGGASSFEVDRDLLDNEEAIYAFVKMNKKDLPRTPYSARPTTPPSHGLQQQQQSPSDFYKKNPRSPQSPSPKTGGRSKRMDDQDETKTDDASFKKEKEKVKSTSSPSSNGVVAKKKAIPSDDQNEFTLHDHPQRQTNNKHNELAVFHSREKRRSNPDTVLVCDRQKDQPSKRTLNRIVEKNRGALSAKDDPEEPFLIDGSKQKAGLSTQLF